MKTIYKISIGIVLSIIIIFGFLSYHNMYNRSLIHHYTYSINIATDSPLDNVTLYIPLPVMNDSSPVGQNMVDEYNDKESRWKFALVDTKHGPMLSMKTDNVEPRFGLKGGGPETYTVPIVFDTMLFVERMIDTKNSIDNEPLLMPKYNLRYTGNNHYYINGDVYEYDSKIYAYYETPNDANVSITVNFDGYNEWWTGGSTSNHYHENILIDLSGPQNGWVTINCKLVTGNGTYLGILKHLLKI